MPAIICDDILLPLFTSHRLFDYIITLIFWKSCIEQVLGTAFFDQTPGLYLPFLSMDPFIGTLNIFVVMTVENLAIGMLFNLFFVASTN